MNDIFLMGVAQAFEKLARSNLKPRAIAESIREGLMTKRLGQKFKISPGEMRKAERIAEKIRRKEMRPMRQGLEKMTPSQVIRQRRLEKIRTAGSGRVAGIQPASATAVTRPMAGQATAIARPPALTQPQAGMTGTVVARPKAITNPSALTLAPRTPAVDPARRRMFATPRSMMYSQHAPGSMGAIKHVFAAWMR